jgi:hypothetical protein
MSAYGASVRKGLRTYDSPASSSDKASEKAVDPKSSALRGILLAVCSGAQSRMRSRKYDAPASSSHDEANNEAALELETVAIKLSSTRKTCLSGILLASKQDYEETAPFLYKACTFFFEDFDLSTKFLTAVSFSNLKHITKMAVYHPQEAEGTIKAITAIAGCPDLSGYHQHICEVHCSRWHYKLGADSGF